MVKGKSLSATIRFLPILWTSRDALLPQQNGESRMNNDRRILDYTPFCIQFCGVLGILDFLLSTARIPNTQNCQQITNESPRAPRNLTPPGSSDKPTWRCQQIPLIGALGIQVICYPRRAFQERLINDRKERMINPWKLARAGMTKDYLKGE